MIKQSECAATFGNPSSPGWEATHLVRVVPPYHMHMGDVTIKSFLFNKTAAPQLLQALNQIWDKCGHDDNHVEALGADVFSGTFAIRTMRGLKTTSMHAYGLAADLNAPENPLGRAPADNPRGFHAGGIVVTAFLDAGAVWGGSWARRPDPMHFQWAVVG